MAKTTKKKQHFESVPAIQPKRGRGRPRKVPPVVIDPTDAILPDNGREARISSPHRSRLEFENSDESSIEDEIEKKVSYARPTSVHLVHDEPIAAPSSSAARPRPVKRRRNVSLETGMQSKKYRGNGEEEEDCSCIPNLTKISCPWCHQLFDSNLFERHKTVLHDHTCSTCGDSYTTSKDLVQHQRLAHERGLCPHCWEAIANEKKFASHVVAPHNEACTLCSYRTQSKVKLEKHIRNHRKVDLLQAKSLGIANTKTMPASTMCRPKILKSSLAYHSETTAAPHNLPAMKSAKSIDLNSHYNVSSVNRSLGDGLSLKIVRKRHASEGPLPKIERKMNLSGQGARPLRPRHSFDSVEIFYDCGDRTALMPRSEDPKSESTDLLGLRSRLSLEKPQQRVGTCTDARIQARLPSSHAVKSSERRPSIVKKEDPMECVESSRINMEDRATVAVTADCRASTGTDIDTNTKSPTAGASYVKNKASVLSMVAAVCGPKDKNIVAVAQSHPLPPYQQCSLCHFYFESVPSLQRHLVRQHKVPCVSPSCPCEFLSRAECARHVFLCHPDVDPPVKIRVCDLCREPVGTNSFQAHSRIDHSKACSLCNLIFINLVHLFNHKVRDHLLKGEDRRLPAVSPPLPDEREADELVVNNMAPAAKRQRRPSDRKNRESGGISSPEESFQPAAQDSSTVQVKKEPKVRNFIETTPQFESPSDQPKSEEGKPAAAAERKSYELGLELELAEARQLEQLQETPLCSIDNVLGNTEGWENPGQVYLTELKMEELDSPLQAFVESQHKDAKTKKLRGEEPILPAEDAVKRAEETNQNKKLSLDTVREMLPSLPVMLPAAKNSSTIEEETHEDSILLSTVSVKTSGTGSSLVPYDIDSETELSSTDADEDYTKGTNGAKDAPGSQVVPSEQGNKSDPVLTNKLFDLQEDSSHLRKSLIHDSNIIQDESTSGLIEELHLSSSKHDETSVRTTSSTESNITIDQLGTAHIGQQVDSDGCQPEKDRKQKEQLKLVGADATHVATGDKHVAKPSERQAAQPTIESRPLSVPLSLVDQRSDASLESGGQVPSSNLPLKPQGIRISPPKNSRLLGRYSSPSACINDNSHESKSSELEYLENVRNNSVSVDLNAKKVIFGEECRGLANLAKLNVEKHHVHQLLATSLSNAAEVKVLMGKTKTVHSGICRNVNLVTMSESSSTRQTPTVSISQQGPRVAEAEPTILSVTQLGDAEPTDRSMRQAAEVIPPVVNITRAGNSEPPVLTVTQAVDSEPTVPNITWAGNSEPKDLTVTQAVNAEPAVRTVTEANDAEPAGLTVTEAMDAEPAVLTVIEAVYAEPAVLTVTEAVDAEPAVLTVIEAVDAEPAVLTVIEAADAEPAGLSIRHKHPSGQELEQRFLDSVSQPLVSSNRIEVKDAQQPAIQQPALQQPTLQQPTFQQPTIQQPTIQKPTIQQPSFQQLSFQQPSFQQPTIQLPTLQQLTVAPLPAQGCPSAAAATFVRVPVIMKRELPRKAVAELPKEQLPLDRNPAMAACPPPHFDSKSFRIPKSLKSSGLHEKNNVRTESEKAEQSHSAPLADDCTQVLISTCMKRSRTSEEDSSGESAEHYKNMHNSTSRGKEKMATTAVTTATSGNIETSPLNVEANFVVSTAKAESDRQSSDGLVSPRRPRKEVWVAFSPAKPVPSDPVEQLLVNVNNADQLMIGLSTNPGDSKESAAGDAVKVDRSEMLQIDASPFKAAGVCAGSVVMPESQAKVLPTSLGRCDILPDKDNDVNDALRRKEDLDLMARLETLESQLDSEMSNGGVGEEEVMDDLAEIRRHINSMELSAPVPALTAASEKGYGKSVAAFPALLGLATARRPELVVLDDSDDDELGKYSPASDNDAEKELPENLESISSFLSRTTPSAPVTTIASTPPSHQSEDEDFISDVDDLLVGSDDDHSLAGTPTAPRRSATKSHEDASHSSKPPQQGTHWSEPILIAQRPAKSSQVSADSSLPKKDDGSYPPLSLSAQTAVRRMSNDGGFVKQSGKKNAVCPHCEELFTEKELSSHARRDHAYQCNFCPLRFTYVNGRDNHQNSAHTLEACTASQFSLSCRLCGLGFSRNTAYDKHAKREHNVPCRERSCRRRFTNVVLMETHADASHTKTANIIPAETGVGTSKPLDKKNVSPPVRVRNVYSGATIVDSPSKKVIIGGSAVSSASAVSASSKSLALDDLQATNSRICALFDIKENSAGLKKKRGRPKKASKTSSLASSSPPLIEKDDTRCEQCGKQIPDFEEFYEHINTDHGEQCTLCGMAFVQEFYLREHRYLLHGEPPPPLSDRPPSPPRRPRLSQDHLAFAPVELDDDSDVAEDISLPHSPVHDSSLEASTSSLASYRIPKLNRIPAVSSPAGTRLLFPCEECSEAFPTAAGLAEHGQRCHYDPSQPCGSNSATAVSGNAHKCLECGLDFVEPEALSRHTRTHERQVREGEQACHLCGERFPRSKMTQHLLQKHADGKALPGLAVRQREVTCQWCFMKFRCQDQLRQHQRLEHKLLCSFSSCQRRFVLTSHLTTHLEEVHGAETDFRREWTCQQCRVTFPDAGTWQQHEATSHTHICLQDDCGRAFTSLSQLNTHLSAVHNVYRKLIGSDGVVTITTERSRVNREIAEWAETWISSSVAVERMLAVMSGRFSSRRHELFLNKREREQCNGTRTSHLYQLSNPGFLGGGGEKDSAVVRQLHDLFLANFHKADKEVRKLGKSVAFVYTTCVLFPETFIHKHETLGKSRKEAEQAFMESVIDSEEREAFSREIEEAVARRLQQTESDSGDEWVDHSDMSDEDT